jgi:hypothetical protein
VYFVKTNSVNDIDDIWSYVKERLREPKIMCNCIEKCGVTYYGKKFADRLSSSGRNKDSCC